MKPARILFVTICGLVLAAAILRESDIDITGGNNPPPPRREGALYEVQPSAMSCATDMQDAINKASRGATGTIMVGAGVCTLGQPLFVSDWGVIDIVGAPNFGTTFVAPPSR